MISRTNIEQVIAQYQASVDAIENPLINYRGLELLQTMKRGVLGAGPYPHVSVFEAANRILSDLVILQGVKWLLEKNTFPFDAYSMEYGTDDETGYDVTARRDGRTLKGEAFNVAPSFFQTKKSKMLTKLRKAEADFKVLLFNDDAVDPRYAPKPRENEYFVLVGIMTGVCRIVSN